MKANENQIGPCTVSISPRFKEAIVRWHTPHRDPKDDADRTAMDMPSNDNSPTYAYTSDLRINSSYFGVLSDSSMEMANVKQSGGGASS